MLTRSMWVKCHHTQQNVAHPRPIEVQMGVLEYNGIQDDYSLTPLASHKVPYSIHAYTNLTNL
jgi:hypothetical protein